MTMMMASEGAIRTTITRNTCNRLCIFLCFATTSLLSCFDFVEGNISLNSLPIRIGIQNSLSTKRRQKPSLSSSSSSVSHAAGGWYNDYCDDNDDELSLIPSASLVSSRSSTTSTTKTIPVAAKKKTQQQKASSSSSQSSELSRSLSFYETMIAGAISRSVAQTVMHPANTMKTILQTKNAPNVPNTAMELMKPKYMKMLTRGAGANFILSLPHGAINFAVLEGVRSELNHIISRTPILNRNINIDRAGPGLDFLSSAISTICCSVVSTPQMMITDNIMAGFYPNLPKAVSGLATQTGKLSLNGFYSGWWPGLVGKIPSYGLTWAFFQELKSIRNRLTHYREATNVENSIMGCIASGTTVCLMIPIDTIKTRLVTQGSSAAVSSAGAAAAAAVVPYKGVIDCGIRVFKEEGMMAFYRGLPPRLISVVPMIGIQFAVYEAMKKIILKYSHQQSSTTTITTAVNNKSSNNNNNNNAMIMNRRKDGILKNNNNKKVMNASAKTTTAAFMIPQPKINHKINISDKRPSLFMTQLEEDGVVSSSSSTTTTFFTNPKSKKRGGDDQFFQDFYNYENIMINSKNDYQLLSKVVIDSPKISSLHNKIS